MKAKDLISIIVPIYNVDKYLDKCLSSLSNQTYKNIEIICINDGSTDNSPSILKRWKKIDDRLIIINKENGGLSSARNRGLDIAKGKYIFFLDSDDFVENHLIETLYDDLIKSDSDLAICNRYYFFEDGTKKIRFKKYKTKKLMNKIQALENLINMIDFDMSAWGKLYKKELLDDIRFPEGKISEDYYIMYKVFDRCSRVTYNSEPLLYYVQRKGSISNNKSINKDYIDAAKNQMEFINDKYPNLEIYANSAYLLSYLTIYNKYLNNPSNITESFHQECKRISKQYKKYVYQNDKLSIIRKMEVFIFINFNCIYKYILKLYKR